MSDKTRENSYALGGWLLLGVAIGVVYWPLAIAYVGITFMAAGVCHCWERKEQEKDQP